MFNLHTNAMTTKLISMEVRRISIAVHEVTGYGIESLTSDSRVRSLITAKTLLCYFLHRKFNDHEILSNILCRHRSNAYNLLKKHADLMATDKLYQQYTSEIEKLLNQKNDETKS